MSKQRVLICPNMLGPEGVNKVGRGERGILYSRKFFTGPNFCENPVSPPEEIFSVLIFVFSASY